LQMDLLTHGRSLLASNQRLWQEYSRWSQ